MDPVASSALVVTVICWGIVPVILVYLKDYIDPWTANGIRYPLSAMLYWPVIFRRGAVSRSLMLRALPPALMAGVGQIFWANTAYHLDASLIGFFVQISVVWSIGGAMFFFKDERRLLRSRLFYGGILLAVAGFSTLMIAAGALEKEATLLGVLLVLGCALFFGCYPVSVRKCMPKDPPLVAFGVVAQYVSIVLVVLMFIQGDPGQLRTLQSKEWALIAVSSLLGIGIAHVLLNSSPRCRPRSTASCVRSMPVPSSPRSRATSSDRPDPQPMSSIRAPFVRPPIAIVRSR